MSVDHYFVLVLAEIKDGVKGSPVVVEGQHHDLLQEAEHGDLS